MSTSPATPDSIESGTRSLVAFNARTMPVGEIVKTFVEPLQFERLRRPVNSLLSGPRGSGKTTMLKMLQPAALELWNGDAAAEVSAEVPYTGVFIATDRAWKRQIEPHVDKDNPFQPEIRLVGESAFTAHVLREIVSAMRYRLSPPSSGKVRRSRATMPSEKDATRLAVQIAEVAMLDRFEPSLGGVADGLTIRISALQNLQKALREARNFPIPAWIESDCLASATAIIDLFNRTVGQEDHQWALLFDEMELAPTTIVQTLLDSMRGQPSFLLMKLSISPVQPELSILNLPYSGVAGQDFDLIPLTYPRQENAIFLGRKMLDAELKRRGLVDHSLNAVMGRSAFASFDDGDGGRDRADYSTSRSNPYAVRSELWQAYQSLADIDPTFVDWLKAKKVDLNDLAKLSPAMRASTLRKIRNLVVVREHYRKAGALRRSRKSFGLYTGLDSIVAFCDGNPRLLTALLGQLLAPQAMMRNTVTRSRQSHAIESIMARFFSLIYSAEAVETSNGTALSLAELVIKVGDAFADRVIDYPFSDNVPLSFTVDRKISEEYIKLLRTGINMGVFVHIPNRSDERLPLDLIGEHFRLSYVLAPYFGLPIRLGRPIALSTLLLQEIRYRREFRSNLIRTPNVQNHQYSLFLEPQIRKSE